MPDVTIENIPDDLYEQLKIKANLNNRSIDSEILACLVQALLPNKLMPEERLSQIEQLRTAISPNQITAQNIDQEIDKGRP
jgi:antitoxin FitA